MKEKWLLLSLIGFLISCSKQESMDALTARVFTVAEQQYLTMDTRLEVTTLPQSIASDSTFKSSTIYWWCSGFYPGSLWYIYEYTQNEAVKTLAEKNTLKLDPIQYVTNDHDVGFQLNCSYGNGFRLTGNEDYKKVLYQGAQSLATRFSSVTGVIRSWDFLRRGWKYPVIIDNMMNLELLFWATQATGDSTFYDIAVKHADTTLKNHFRADNSLYHGLNYNPETGEIKHYQGGQGFSEKSAWARGQAWGLYGYTLMYRFTKERKYLEQAIKIAEFTLNHPNMPKDLIPYWDYNAPGIPDALRDASAAAINCSGLLELSQYVSEERAKKYYKAAEKILQTLSSPAYTAEEGTNGGFILKHSVGNIPSGTEVDMPLTYADYYYVEALCRYKSLNDKP